MGQREKVWKWIKAGCYIIGAALFLWILVKGISSLKGCIDKEVSTANTLTSTKIGNIGDCANMNGIWVVEDVNCPDVLAYKEDNGLKYLFRYPSPATARTLQPDTITSCKEVAQRCGTIFVNNFLMGDYTFFVTKAKGCYERAQEEPPLEKIPKKGE